MCTVAELGNEIAELAARLDAATHRLLTCIRQFDASNEWNAQGAVSCAHWLCWRIGLDQNTAREKVRVARALGNLPAIDDALRVAKLSYAKVRALTRVATPSNEATLLELALHATGAQLERLCRAYRGVQTADEGPSPEQRCVRKRLLPGGMVKLELVLAPDEADLVMRAVDRARELSAEPPRQDRAVAPEAPPADPSAERPDESPAWPSRADGVVTLAESFLSGRATHGSGGDRYQVILHVDQDMLGPDGAMAATLDDNTRISAETLRRVACDCGLVAVGSHGGQLNIGRKTRTIPSAIRRMLLLRDRGCAFPGCTHTRFLHGHHLRHWLHGGETSVGNLASLCPAHHHLVHEGGWTVERTATGELAFTSPTGQPLPAEPPREQIEDTLTWLQEWTLDRDLDLGPDANQPLWDGTRLDYDCAVSAMLAAG